MIANSEPLKRMYAAIDLLSDRLTIVHMMVVFFWWTNVSRIYCSYSRDQGICIGREQSASSKDKPCFLQHQN